jgi:hypothetical protein
MLASIVDWSALGQVVVYSFAAALVLTFLFTTGVLAGPRRVLGSGSYALCGALVVLGLYVMFTSWPIASISTKDCTQGCGG